MNKLFIIFFICLLLVGSVSAYYCIEQEDNNEVKEFKSKVNMLALEQDIESHSITQEAFKMKIKYFNRCK